MDYLTSSEAINLLKSHPDNYITPESIRDLVKRIDTRTPGEITIFYSGNYTDSISAQQIVKAMYYNGDNIRIIDKTQITNFIESSELKEAAGQSFGITDLLKLLSELNDRTTPSSLNQFFFDAENGLWADASRRFAAETVGEVRTLTANTRLHTQIR